MIVTYVPALEDVVADLLPHLWEEVGLARKVLDILTELKNMGYDVSTQVEVTGPMADALQSVGGDYAKLTKDELNVLFPIDPASPRRGRPRRSAEKIVGDQVDDGHDDTWADNDVPPVTVAQLDAADERDGVG